MLTIEISPNLREAAPDIALGCLFAEVRVSPSSPELWAEITRVIESIRLSLSIEKISQLRPVKDAREAYRMLGKDPTRYRLAAEALMRRIVKGMELYQVNNVVDINNLVSLASYFSLGVYDLDKIGEKIIFRPGVQGESYEGIGRGLLNLENLPVFADESGSFASPTSDSERSMVTSATRRILLNIISFSGEEGLSAWQDYAQELLTRFAEGRDFWRMIVRPAACRK